ncbi:proteasome regulatory particle base subunit [Malassezia vespertilionis]|uniref:26S proteasome regulatory subunit RPN1 n=1 Tax=Malassezia vespertilionis TaxID=2020962 RepID=A0A2N1J8H5_9BASI|nr:proteasome regulatory particle base subunit [Malassezia vespertilionis]PKI82848.1 Rpn1p [Malassezia vespertilionis]WFD08192.1 proteasome regulatory particle base subunit [Malassezia vespertilionis]
MAREEQEAESIRVQSNDPPKQEDHDAPNKEDAKPNSKKELSEEDEQLKSELEMLVDRLGEPDKSLYGPALEALRNLIRTSTSSMTSVPKPLKFLGPHYAHLKGLYEAWATADANKALFAEILSVLAMSCTGADARETLLYRLSANTMRGGTSSDLLGDWGHEYVRHLAAELGDEYYARSETEQDTSELLDLAMLIVQFSLQHHAEVDAVDLVLELEAVEQLPQYVDKDSFERVCNYLVSCVDLLVPPDDVLFLRTAREIYRMHHRYYEALILSIRLADPALMRIDFASPSNMVMRKQMAFLLAKQQIPLEWLQEGGAIEDQELLDCLSNTHLSSNFIYFGKELGVYEPKSLDDVYKTHLEDSRASLISVDSARGNLANVFVNAFVNLGFGNDPLVVGAEDGESYVYKTKEHGMLSATASAGLSLLWDTEMGLSHIDKYTYSSDEHVKAGAMLAYGILHSNVRTEMDAALALLSENLESKSAPLQVSSVVGLGLAYAGSCREDLAALLIPMVQDETLSMEVVSLATLSLGFIFVGTAHGEIVPSILQAMMEREASGLEQKWTRFMALGLALLFVGQQDNSDATIETLKAIEHPISKEVQLLVDACSYAGTGNVLKIQTLLHHCAEHVTEEEESVSDLYQAVSVLGIALVAMGEDVGAEMTLRHMSHLMQYGDPTIRRTVPLALALLNPSNPEIPVLDTLSKHSHDSDVDVALNAIFAMGIVGAGTNNARIAQRLRQLASYYYKEPDCLFIVRIAQGLVHMGKGTVGVDPYHTDRLLFSRTALAGLLATLLSFTDAHGFVLDRTHWMLYFLAAAIRPRFLITLDETLEKLPVSVRVGKAVEVVGQAGKPRTISGFQTHTTPVRLASHERGVLATEEYLSYTPIMESLAILRKNPGNETDS